MNQNPKIPVLSQELVDWLDWLVPERCPDPSQSGREIWMYAGKRQVVRKLKDLLAKQSENILSSP